MVGSIQTEEEKLQDLELFDPKELHREIMNEVWSLYCNASANEEWIDMPPHIDRINEKIDALVAHALGLKSRPVD